MPIYAFIVLKIHNNAYLTYIHAYIHIITHITHVVNTYKHNNMKIPHKFRHIKVNFLQSVRLQVTYSCVVLINVNIKLKTQNYSYYCNP